jgi:hypothetical protein
MNHIKNRNGLRTVEEAPYLEKSIIHLTNLLESVKKLNEIAYGYKTEYRQLKNMSHHFISRSKELGMGISNFVR